MPDYPEEAVQRAAEVRLRQYESEFNASHLSWQDFAGEVREMLDAAAPVLAEAVAQKILAFMEAHMPPDGPGAARKARRHVYRSLFSTAARIAAGAFTTRGEMLKMAAEAIASGNYAACVLDDAGQPAGEGQ